MRQCKVLVRLSEHEGISQARLAQVTDIEPMMIVRLVNAMEQERLLERCPDPADRRAHRLYLTDKARPLLEEIWRLATVTRAEMFRNVSRQDRDTFLRVLEQAQLNLAAPQSGDAAAPAAPQISSTRHSRISNQVKS
ncbi:MAG: MarR family transcriptional regulator [Steroidobacteraceae bacterium]